MRRKWIAVVGVIGMVASMQLTALAATPIDTEDFQDAVTVAGVRAHQAALQAIADANGGTRSSGSPGYQESAEYVRDKLLDAGYTVELQPFEYEFFGVDASAFEFPVLNPVVSEDNWDVMTYSGSGDVTGTAIGVDLALLDRASSTSGCEATDFDGLDFSGVNDVALMQRGACSFFDKAFNAEAAGAEAVIVFNQGNTPEREALFFGTLGGPGVTIPTLSMSYTLGSTLAGETVRVYADTTLEDRVDMNVIAETEAGRSDRVVVVGAHLDSVAAGPGINDNGSGSAAILEIAIQMAEEEISPRNKVRFAWWGAEEQGLIGSTEYVASLSKREIKNIALNLNFDMIGSPNFVRFVYDGDGSATGIAGPNGSGVIEDVFNDYFDAQGLAFEPTEFSGRSDYGPFIEVGIPAGGLFTGAEGIKSPDQASIFGGTAGDQYDPCYHLACDTFDNVSLAGLDEMTDATAHAVLTFAMTTSSVNGTDKGSTNSTKSVEDLEFKGSLNQR
jgi:Zn-dependent M28 family amino/carboxypeptidase